jgi:hypothetical protein
VDSESVIIFLYKRFPCFFIKYSLSVTKYLGGMVYSQIFILNLIIHFIKKT